MAAHDTTMQNTAVDPSITTLLNLTSSVSSKRNYLESLAPELRQMIYAHLFPREDATSCFRYEVLIAREKDSITRTLVHQEDRDDCHGGRPEPYKDEEVDASLQTSHSGEEIAAPRLHPAWAAFVGKSHSEPRVPRQTRLDSAYILLDSRVDEGILQTSRLLRQEASEVLYANTMMSAGLRSGLNRMFDLPNSDYRNQLDRLMKAVPLMAWDNVRQLRLQNVSSQEWAGIFCTKVVPKLAGLRSLCVESPRLPGTSDFDLLRYEDELEVLEPFARLRCDRTFILDMKIWLGCLACLDHLVECLKEDCEEVLEFRPTCKKQATQECKTTFEDRLDQLMGMAHVAPPVREFRTVWMPDFSSWAFDDGKVQPYLRSAMRYPAW
ncbi:hypothetical protein M8818_000128 [Zalaria obscura]|uniref:Uncharacterized protein n=1 Tax=Zalaria obscura TaxID=2024903 RepID=A0ACC3SNQ0_9PEZI